VGFDETGQLFIKFLHSSDTEVEMGVQWNGTSFVSRLQEKL
jgi:hypothetical protein